MKKRLICLAVAAVSYGSFAGWVTGKLINSGIVSISPQTGANKQIKLKLEGLSMDGINSKDFGKIAADFSKMIAVAGTCMPSLSELDGDRLLCVYNGRECAQTDGAVAELMSKDDLLGELCRGEKDKEEITVYLADAQVAEFDAGHIADMIEIVGECFEQSDDWGETMAADIRESPETKAYLEYLNERAKAHTTYWAGERVIVDWEKKGDESYVEPVRHGWWIIPTPPDAYTYCKIVCSVCNQVAGKHQTEYCPRCGAKMDLPRPRSNSDD